MLCKPGQHKTKPRGELEVRCSFEVKKVKDLDSLSTASGVSKRFKMSKNNLKSAAKALGESANASFFSNQFGDLFFGWTVYNPGCGLCIAPGVDCV